VVVEEVEVELVMPSKKVNAQEAPVADSLMMEAHREVGVTGVEVEATQTAVVGEGTRTEEVEEVVVLVFVTHSKKVNALEDPVADFPMRVEEAVVVVRMCLCE
jgi:hypothetical protein